MDNNYLAHYGVIGMKWGVRRYQNADGTLTAEGRRRARKEVRADNKEAFEKGRRATIAARAYKYASVKERKALNKYQAKPNQRRLDKANKAIALTEGWAQEVFKTTFDAEKHYNSLVEKYGKEAIANIQRDKTGMVNESVHTVSDYLMALAGTAGATAMAIAFKSPITMVFTPASKDRLGKVAYKESGRYFDIAKQMREQVEKKAIDSKPQQNNSNWESYKKNLKEHKSEYLERAKKNGTFDMEFLERAPQEKNGRPITDSEIIKEYSKYLDDPDKYNR